MSLPNLGFGSFVRPPDSSAGGELRVDVKGMAVDRVFRFVTGLMPAAGVAVVLSAFDLLHHEPAEGFALLRQWGPWWVIVLLAMYFIWEIARRVIDYLGRLTQAAASASAAMERLADKDDRQIQEIQTLSGYNASMNERLVRRIDGVDGRLRQIMQAMKIPNLDLVEPETVKAEEASGGRSASGGL